MKEKNYYTTNLLPKQTRQEEYLTVLSVHLHPQRRTQIKKSRKKNGEKKRIESNPLFHRYHFGSDELFDFYQFAKRLWPNPKPDGPTVTSPFKHGRGGANKCDLIAGSSFYQRASGFTEPRSYWSCSITDVAHCVNSLAFQDSLFPVGTPYRSLPGGEETRRGERRRSSLPRETRSRWQVSVPEIVVDADLPLDSVPTLCCLDFGHDSRCDWKSYTWHWNLHSERRKCEGGWKETGWIKLSSEIFLKKVDNEINCESLIEIKRKGVNRIVFGDIF